MNHPNICTVYDIGEHEGQNYESVDAHRHHLHMLDTMHMPKAIFR